MAVQSVAAAGVELAVEAEAMPWCVVQTNPRFERMVKQHLEQLGFECYLPMRLVKSSGEGRASRHFRPAASITPQPLFPGYLFVRVAAAGDRWRPIFSTFGVRGVLGKTGEHPQAVKHRYIAMIMKVEADMLAAFAREQTDCPFKAGDQVSALEGLVRGVFMERLDRNRCAILTPLFGSDSRRVELDIAAVLASS